MKKIFVVIGFVIGMLFIYCIYDFINNIIIDYQNAHVTIEECNRYTNDGNFNIMPD